MRSNRRRFLGAVGDASLASFGMPRALHAESSQHPAPLADTWDVSWADRVTGKFRAVFDSTSVEDGAGLVRAIAWCEHYKEVYGTPREDLSPVVVFRHGAIALVMNDEYWKRFHIGKEEKMRPPSGKGWTQVNPIRAAAPGTPEQYAKYNLEKFLGSGGIVLACNWAFGQPVSKFRTADKLTAEQARERAKAHLVPGVILQPNGVFAVLRAQEAGCKYILAS